MSSWRSRPVLAWALYDWANSAFALAVLTAFVPVLSALKKSGLRRYSVLVTRHNLAFEAKWIDGVQSHDEQPLGSPDVSSLADLAASYEMIKSIRPLPVTKETIMPLILAALIPFIGVALTQVPLKQILGEVKGLLLL
jgi:MFS-type transporter involved in bile tolerance (Atg22 family)